MEMSKEKKESTYEDIPSDVSEASFGSFTENGSPTKKPALYTWDGKPIFLKSKGFNMCPKTELKFWENEDW